MSVWMLWAAAAAAPVTAAAPRPPSYEVIEGAWSVDLRVALDDPPYSQPMVLVIAADNTVTGSFYNSEILAGRAGTAQGRSCIAFRTADGKNSYHSSACLIDGRMVGQTWAEGRDFVLPWTAEKR